jgi:hypothetical protein
VKTLELFGIADPIAWLLCKLWLTEPSDVATRDPYRILLELSEGIAVIVRVIAGKLGTGCSSIATLSALSAA